MNASRRILVVLHEDVLGGASRAILRVVPALEARGWEFSFWTPTGSSSEAELERIGARWAGRPRLLRYSWGALSAPPGPVARVRSLPGYARAFRARVRAEAPAVVIANTLLTLPEAAIAARSGSPTVLLCHEMLTGSPQSRGAARLARWAADEVVAPSEACARALAGGGVTAHVIPYGVPIPPAVDRAARDGSSVVVGTAGTVCRRKGSDTFVAAAERVRAALPSADLRMLGALVDGPERPWAEEIAGRAEALGVTTGTRPDMYPELAEWDVFALASRADPFPLAVLEAMASGLPVVGTAVDGIPEQVLDTGILVPPDDPAALAEAILALARDPERRARLGAAARERIVRELTFERQAERLEAVCLAAIDARAARRSA